jgi:hypothetical protein
MIGFVLLLFIFISTWIAMIGAADAAEIKKNWPKYRCRPNVMPFAALYGFNTGENFNFCLMNMFGQEMGTALGPVFQILGTIVSTLVTLLEVANSIRVQFATMMGGINTMFQNFADRFKQLLGAVEMSAYRIKLLMGRLYGTFFALIYMSIAGMAAMQNFTQSILFDFLDTFCFDPETPVEIEGKGILPVKAVQIGDVFAKTKGTVTATFQFAAPGQKMVELGGILVSTNHYVKSLDKWIQAGEHPDAIPKGPWTGGSERPLICFNTSDHMIPIGDHLFLDYDETEDADDETMAWIDSKLNAKMKTVQRDFTYSACVDPRTRIRMADGSTKEIQTLSLGEAVSTGRVVGVIQKQVSSICRLPTGERVSPGLSVWTTDAWARAGDTNPRVKLDTPETFWNLVVLKPACFETAAGTVVRDYVEVHSPDAEQFYATAVETAHPTASCVLAE